eukprot:SAG31_NODE_7969_length_1552_cov_1.327598_1_plen_190_part_10
MLPQVLELNPPFDLEKDWNLLTAGSSPEANDSRPATFGAFEQWWRTRLGVLGQPLPVLPEFIAMRLESEGKQSEKSIRGDIAPGKKRWLRLAVKVHMLITFRRKLWGNQGMYNVQEGSVFMDQPLGDCVINPEGSFRQTWDVTQVLLLGYVSCMVPLRSAFEIETEVGDTGFWIDLFVDIFFITDLVLNF